MQDRQTYTHAHAGTHTCLHIIFKFSLTFVLQLHYNDGDIRMNLKLALTSKLIVMRPKVAGRVSLSFITNDTNVRKMEDSLWRK